MMNGSYAADPGCTHTGLSHLGSVAACAENIGAGPAGELAFTAFGDLGIAMFDVLINSYCWTYDWKTCSSQGEGHHTKEPVSISPC